jgi:MFS family permease
VSEVTAYRLAIPFWAFVFALPFRAAVRRPPSRRAAPPWWGPPDAPDARASRVLGLLCALALVDGYVSTLLTQTVTYVSADFGTSRGAQGVTLALARCGALLTLVAAALADRHGRRRLIIVAATGACLAAAAGALVPSLWLLGATQVIAVGCAGALGVLTLIVSAEEMPRGSRAYALTLLVMTGALGAGMCLWALPLADTGASGWRLVYLVPLLGLPLVAVVAKQLPESRRFERPHADAALGDHGRRLWLLASVGFLIALFALPAVQFQNDYLRTERGFSAARISLFTIATGTPAVIGLVAGGWWADRHGRRAVAATGIVLGAAFTVAVFVATGWPLWAWSLAASIFAALAVPALGVYRPELFPTGLRGTAAGAIEVVAVAGGALGLVAVGFLADRWDGYAAPMALLFTGTVVAAGVVLATFPETAHRSLEQLNPADDDAAATPTLDAS